MPDVEIGEARASASPGLSERRFPVRACPVCGCERSSVLFEQSFDHLSGASLLDGYNVVICEDCGAGFADDIPPQPVFDRYYRDLSKYDHADRADQPKPGSEQRFQEIADTIVPFLRGPDIRIVDIGCGSGELLKVLRERGFRNVLGVDPSPGCIRTAQSLYGVPGIAATILTVPVPEELYDAIILIGVMEHIRDIDPAVEQLDRLLAEGGRIYLEVPDASRYIPSLDAPFQEFSIEHINFFGLQSLTNLMQRRGFVAVAGGHAIRLQNEVTCPATYVVFEKAPAGLFLPIERDRETEAGLRKYIQGGQGEDARIRRVIEQAVPRGGKMIVWGVGTHTLRLLATHGLDADRVALFVDSSPKYQGQELHGVPVVSPEILKQRREPILISSRGFQREIHHQIRNTLGLTNPVILLYDQDPDVAAAFEERLERLLAESGAAAEKREREAFDQAAHPYERQIVIYGAGELGRKVLAALRAHGLDALAFVDRDAAAWSRPLDGLPVLALEEAVSRFGANSVFVVAIWNASVRGGVSGITRDLKSAGCCRVVPFLWLAWKYSEPLLPHYLWDRPSRILHAADDVRRAYALFEEPKSRDEFLRHLEFRLTGDPDCLAPLEDDVQYFPRQLFRSRPDECFVDCGAYDGDTLLGLLDWSGGECRRAIAYEADPANFAALERTIREDERLHSRAVALRVAVGARREKLRFAASGLVSSSVSSDGDIQVDAIPLDEGLAGETATYIKMDIEGAESDALEGAASVLRRDQPLMAVCLYHRQDHLWSIPLFLREHLPEARFLLRSYAHNGFELVCYAVPPARLGNRVENVQP